MQGFRGFLIVFVLCAAVGFAVLTTLWRRYAPVVEEFAASAEADAADFAQGRDQSACVSEAFRRLAECEGLSCQIRVPMFTRLCLDRAAPDPTLCDDVPDSIFGAATWPMTECLDIDADPEGCARILQEQVRVCLGREEAA